MTTDQYVFLVFISTVLLFGVFVLVSRSKNNGRAKAKRRPRYLVSIPATLISSDKKTQLRTDLSADTERDYVFVDVNHTNGIQVIEIR